MAIIELRHVVRAMPHGARLRKRRGRLLKPVKPSHKVELWYKQQLLAIVAQLRKIAREELLPELRMLEPLYSSASDGMARDRMGFAGPQIEARIDALKRRFGGITGVAQRLAEAATRRSLEAADDRLKASVQASAGIDISGFLSRQGPIQSVVEAATKANVALIKSIPEQHFDKLQDALLKNMERGMRFEDLAKEIERIGDVTESRAKLIARDQTSKMNGAMTQIRQMSLGIERYVWQTSGDERVRDAHADLDGREFRWSDPPAEGHPGEAVNCRCVAIPVFDLDDPDDAGGVEAGAISAPSSMLSVGAAAVTIAAMFGEMTAKVYR